MGRDASQTVSTLLGRKNREKSNRFIHKYISKRIYLQFHYYFQSNLFFSFYPSTFLFERSKRKNYNIHKFAAKRNKIFKFSPTPIHRRTLLINYSLECNCSKTIGVVPITTETKPRTRYTQEFSSPLFQSWICAAYYHSRGKGIHPPSPSCSSSFIVTPRSLFTCESLLVRDATTPVNPFWLRTPLCDRVVCRFLPDTVAGLITPLRGQEIAYRLIDAGRDGGGRIFPIWFELRLVCFHSDI